MHILHIETVVPQHQYRQTEIMAAMIRMLGASEKMERYLRQIYRRSGIETRHSVLGNLLDDPRVSFLAGTPADTKTRNDIFITESNRLLIQLARAAVERCPGVTFADITHVITVSCTGFYNPGPDFVLVNELPFRKSTQRFHLGFMGCYAAFPALRMADSFCAADPNATVLVVCLELCTLHFHRTEVVDDILAASLFADGGAAAIARQTNDYGPEETLKVESFRSAIIPSTTEHMRWVVGNFGFDMVLSSDIAEIIGTHLGDILGELFADEMIRPGAIDYWAIHPGGRAIIDVVEKALMLESDQVAASRATLRRFGNMSSPTILFVLQALMRQMSAMGRNAHICAMAFGPGLTVETALLRFIPTPAADDDRIVLTTETVATR